MWSAPPAPTARTTRSTSSTSATAGGVLASRLRHRLTARGPSGRLRDGTQPAACSAVSSPSSQAPAPVAADLARTVHPPLLAEAEHVLRGHHRECGARGREPARRDPTDRIPGSARRASPCRAWTCRRPGSRGGSRGGVGWSGRRRRTPRCSTAMPGKPSSSRSSYTSGVIKPRSSATTGSGPSSRSAARNGSAPGPGTTRPARVGLAVAGIAQKPAKPRKWSIRTASTS